jgi:hypothetical protein
MKSPWEDHYVVVKNKVKLKTRKEEVEVDRWYVADINMRIPIFTKSSPDGYEHLVDAIRAANHHYLRGIRVFEKLVLGQ